MHRRAQDKRKRFIFNILNVIFCSMRTVGRSQFAKYPYVMRARVPLPAILLSFWSFFVTKISGYSEGGEKHSRGVYFLSMNELLKLIISKFIMKRTKTRKQIVNIYSSSCVNMSAHHAFATPSLWNITRVQVGLGKNVEVSPYKRNIFVDFAFDA